MKKIKNSILVLLLLVVGYLCWNFLQIKPLEVGDILEASSTPLVGRINLAFETGSLGQINKDFLNPWSDNNNFVNDEKHPLLVSVSNQEGPVPEQILNITYDKNKTAVIYLPALSGQGGYYGSFYVAKDGSTYWACKSKQPCDTEVYHDSKSALKKDNVARKAP